MRVDRWTGLPMGVAALALVLGAALGAQAGQAPAAAGVVPDGAAFALLVDRPGEAVGAALGLLDRFKGLSPELARERLSQEVVKELGEDVLTPAGMRAFGLDPDGGLAVFGASLEGEPELLLPLADAEAFVARVQALGQKKGEAFAQLPKGAAGARVWRSGRDYLAVGPRHALLLSGLETDALALKRIQAVLGGGKKLASGKAFQKALRGLPPGAHAVLFMDFARVAKGALGEMDVGLKAEEKYVASLPAAQRKPRDQDLARMRAVRKRFAALLGKFDALAWGLRVEERGVVASVLLGAAPAGRKLLEAAFPAGGPSAFHAALAGRSLWSGWASVRPAGLIELLADLPESPRRSVRDGLAEADAAVQEDLGMSLLKDVLGNLREPMGFYFLSPDLSGMRAEEPMQQQVLRLFKVAGSARVADPARLDALLAKVVEKATAAGQAPAVSDADGARLITFRPEAGVVFGLGRKGDLALLGFGEDALGAIAQAAVGGAGPAQGNLRAAGRMDAAAVGELLSSAVAKNIGGQEGMGFRMLWPLVQQALGQVSDLQMEGGLVAEGLQARWTISFR